MADTNSNYDHKRLPARIKTIREHRSKQYKYAKQYFEDIAKISDKKSDDYRNAETYFKKYIKFKSCTSQEALAEAVEVKRQTIIDWEKGKTYPSVEKLVLLCSTFDCNMDYLFGLVETPITEPVSIAHYFSHIDSSIIKYGLENEDYLNCLNFFMLPENCASLFNDITISAWREYNKRASLDEILSPLKEEIIDLYEEYIAITPMQLISKSSYTEYLTKKLPREKLYPTKTPPENGFILKDCFKWIIYQRFFTEKEFNYSAFINYLVENTFDSLSQSTLIKTKKIILANRFIDLFEKYLER